MRIVIGIGGNALLQRKQKPEIATQQLNVRQACQAIAPLMVKHQIIITHGNGPQVGLLAEQAAAYQAVSPYPLDVLTAESQGMIGYLLMQEFQNLLPSKKIAVLLTQVAVDAHDRAFAKPTKFIGPVYSKEASQEIAKNTHWKFAADGDYFRRVVPSPLPKAILEIDTIRLLVESQIVVICVGGGGIPVVYSSDKKYSGIEAVIDKDMATAVLAEELNADHLMLLTDVPNVFENWHTNKSSPINRMSAKEIAKLSFASGSMQPKVQAACQFVQHTGHVVHIGLLTEAAAILAQKAGTTIF